MYSWTTLKMFLLVMSSYIGHPFNKISILTATSMVDIDCALILLYLLQCNKLCFAVSGVLQPMQMSLSARWFLYKSDPRELQCNLKRTCII